MHDLSVAQDIARCVLKESENHRVDKVVSIEIEIGELTFLSPPQVEF